MPASDESFPGDVFTASAEQEALYVNNGVRQALDAVLHGIRGGRGIVTLIGESGTGKTTLLRYVAAHFQQEALFVFIQNPPDTFDELIDILFAKLGAARSEETRIAVRLVRLGELLLQRLIEDRRVVLFIDEAQQLSDPVLKQLRLLANLETSREKLLQIVVCGQPELLDRLKRPDFARVHERITVWAKLEPLRPHEVLEYVTTRFVAAGAERRGYLRDRELKAIGKAAAGIPRVVNVLCEHSLTNASTRSSLPAGPLDVARAIREVTGQRSPVLAMRSAFGGMTWALKRALDRHLRIERSLGMAVRSRLPERPTRLAVLMAGGAMALVLAAVGLNIADTGTLRSAWERYVWTPRSTPAAAAAPRLVSVDQTLAVAAPSETDAQPAALSPSAEAQMAASMGAALQAAGAAAPPAALQTRETATDPLGAALASATEPAHRNAGDAGAARSNSYKRAGAPWCGDGVLDLAEECDDGNGSDSDVCLNNCLQAVCGDGILHVGVEECDDGNARNDDSCLFGCALARCGDGYVQSGVEVCDDGNDIEDDGCSTHCTKDFFVKLPVR